MSSNTEQRKLAAIMFTDMVGYSALSQRNEALALELLEEHRGVLRGLFPKHQGTEIKTTGDGFLVEFASALAAVRCAVEIQRALAERNQAQPAERQVRIRIGIHLGDVVRSAGDVHGDGVNIAARIEPLAEPGGICISNSVYDQIENKVEHALVRLSRPELKNIQASVQVYRLVLDGARPAASAAPNRRRQAIALGMVALLVAGLLLMLKLGARPKSAASATNAPTSAAGQKSIAVLPFVSMSADKADEYLSDGMTEELLNVLAQVPGLRVPGRSSSFAFKGKNEEGIFRKVGEQLHVATVLEGSVRKAGDKLRITAQLINVADGFHLWSTNYDRDMKDILAVQSEVAHQVVQVLQVKLGMEATRALAKTSTENPEAHRLYLLGRYHFGKLTEASLTNAMQYFTQALQQDPSYALAYCGLADCYAWMGGGLLSGKEAWAKEKELAQKAVALDPNLADAHLSLGMALAGAFDWNGGEQEIKRALELNPRLAMAYDQLAWLQTMFGRFEEAIRNKQKAIELDPLSLMFNTGLSAALEAARRYDEAMAQCRKTLELDSNFAAAHLELGWCFVYKGDTAAAIAEFQKAKALDPAPWTDGALAYAYARAGDRTQAEQMVRKWDDRVKQRYISPSLRALLHLGLGEKDKGLDWLERCYEEQDGFCSGLKIYPGFDPLRTEPRFQALLKKVGLEK
ncbi:MAG TPA: adenylate/guanylate cyclase domain-containing protein [Verrucomicrobiae bacterium]|nr:adenylate/guanylate cyclase domain-containing protein [Verrucomicrobiae bacterium]